MPFPKHKYPSEAAAPVHLVEGLLHRKLTNIIKSAFQEKSASEFHLSPFEEYWKPSSDAPPERIYSELYNSNTFLKVHKSIQKQPCPNCNLQIIIMPMMLWSLWPIYMFNGAQSKYTRAKPTSFAAHHIVYIPKLDDAIYNACKHEFLHIFSESLYMLSGGYYLTVSLWMLMKTGLSSCSPMAFSVKSFRASLHIRLIIQKTMLIIWTNIAHLCAISWKFALSSLSSP
ncbi:hypothetical protein B0H34DRAFT_852402 [Crassisporium funariophilum]|nr:hypothetical protein B0H34DRAFT_852402 [Crassisporium funariophilum]